MITQKQIDARDEYITALKMFVPTRDFITLSDLQQAIDDADREATEMQSNDVEKLALWDDIKEMLFYLRHHKCRYSCQCDNNTMCMSCSHKIKVDDLIKCIEAIGATTKDDTPEIKATWDKAVERCAKGLIK